MEARDISKMLAKSYSEAALTGCNMFRATEALEATRNILIDDLPSHKADEKMSHLLGIHLNENSLFSVIFKIRKRYRSQKLRNHELVLTKLLVEDPEKGWEEWLEVFAHEVALLNYNFCDAFLNLNWDLPQPHTQTLEKLRHWTSFMLEYMWVETLPMIEYLSDFKFLTDEVKAGLFGIAGQIELLHLVNTAKAQAYFEDAANLLPNKAQTEVNFAGFYIENGEYEKAEKHCQKAMEIDKDDTSVYQLFGDYNKKREKAETAANWYRDGLIKNQGNVELHERFIQLNENADYFKKHAHKIDERLITIERLDSRSLYLSTINAGYVYQKQQEFERAEAYYKQAIKLRPKGFLGLLNLAYNYLDSKQLKLSEKTFNKLVQIMPEAFDSYWGLAALYNVLEEWEKAIDNLKICLEKRPGWKTYIYNDMANAYLKLNRLAEGEKYALLALKHDTEGLRGINALYDRVDNLGMEEARNLLDKIREVMPADYTQNYLYRLGTIYYKAEEFHKAFQSFHSAASEKPEKGGVDPGYILEYMGLCQERLGDYENAEKYYIQAIEREPKEAKYYNRVGFMLSQIGRYEEAITYYNQAIALLPWPAYLENRGLAYEKLQNIKQAEKDFKLALETATSDWDIYENRLGVFYKNTGDIAASIQFYTKAINRIPKAVYYDNLGISQNLIGDYPSAEASFKKAIEINPSYGQYYNRLAFFYIEQEAYSAAIPILKKAIEVEPASMYYENLGYAYENLKDLEKALSAYQKALEIAVKADRDIYENRLGNYYLNRQAYAEAIEYYDKAIMLRPDVANYHTNKGKAAAALNRNDEAEESFKVAVQLAGNEKYKQLNELGWFYCDAGRYSDALSCFEEAFKLFEDPLYIENLGYAHEALGHYEIAENYYKQALEKSGKNTDRYLNRLGIFHLNRGDYAAAIDFYQKAIAINPLNVYLENLVSVAHITGNMKLFEETLQKLIEANPNEVRYLFELGWNLADNPNDTDRSIAYLKRALALYKETPEIEREELLSMHYLGVLHERQGNLDQALNLFLEAHELAPDDASICNFVGKVYFGKGDYENALIYYKKALSIHPGDEIIYQSIATIYSTMGNVGLLEKTLIEGSEKNPILYEFLAKFYIDRADFVNAHKSLKLALAAFPNNNIYLFHTALVLKQLTQYSEAEKILKRLIKQAGPSGNHVYYNELGNVAYAKKDFSLARDNYQKAIDLMPENETYSMNLDLATAFLG